MNSAVRTDIGWQLSEIVLRGIPDTEWNEYLMSWENLEFVCKQCANGKHKECKGVGWCDCQHRIVEGDRVSD